jgi:hypothetical protein
MSTLDEHPSPDPGILASLRWIRAFYGDKELLSY